MAAEEHGFKAEVRQLLDLMIHSLYSDKEIFLRELVSNAADALDKARFTELTREDLVAARAEPGVRVTVHADTRTIVIEDDGVGLTRDEAIANLGTIAHSGSREFLGRLKDASAADAPGLIGQFGVGFYSAFMVAEQVVVESRSLLPDEPAIRWISTGEGGYTLEETEREHRGTRITLHLREDASEFADTSRLRQIVRKHSNYLAWPILVDGEQANSGKALWAENPSSVTDDEASAFYKTLAMDWNDPALRVHVKVDSPLQYSALLFIPSDRPFDLFQPEAARGPRLYAKRVLIMEHARELLPDWLRFVRGAVDSEDIDLNVSREMVQKTPIVRKIRDALTKRILKDLERLAQAPADEEPDEGAEHNRHQRYLAIWRSFGQVLKEGYFHAREWREQLLPLLRFNAVSHEDGAGLLSLAEYKERMAEGQDAIWTIGAADRASALVSPHLEAFRKRGWDVLILTDAVDEWLAQELTEFDGTPIKSVTRGELELDDADLGERADLTGLAPWLEGLFVDDVAQVRASTRLTDSPCVLVESEQGMSANMERILRAARESIPGAKRILELNPRHPIVKNLAELHETGRQAQAEPLARLLLDDARLLEGTVLDAPGVGRRLQALLELASSAALAQAPAPTEEAPA